MKTVAAVLSVLLDVKQEETPVNQRHYVMGLSVGSNQLINLKPDLQRKVLMDNLFIILLMVGQLLVTIYAVWKSSKKQ